MRQRQREPPPGPHATSQLAKRLLVAALAADVLEHRDARRVVEALVGERQRATVADPKLEIGLVAGDALPLLDLLRELVDGRHPDATPGERDAEQLRAREVQDAFPPGGAQTTKGPGNLEIPARIHRNGEPDDRLAQVPAAGELTQT